METLLQSVLTAANMRRYLPENLRPGLKGGIFFGLLQHTVFPASVGEVVCTELSDKAFGANGQAKIDLLRIDEKFDALATLTSDTSAHIVEKLRDVNVNAATIPMSDRITYLYRNGDIEASVEQTFANQNFFHGSFVEFWVKHNVSGYPYFNIRLWWEKT